MILNELYEVVIERIKTSNPDKSYVARLHSSGEEKILKKVQEECFELLMAVKDKNRTAIIYETADLLFHVVILLAEREIKPDEIFDELKRRFGISGLEEKKQRKGEKNESIRKNSSNDGL